MSENKIVEEKEIVLRPSEEYRCLSNKTGQKKKKEPDENEAPNPPKREDNGDDL